MMVTRDDLPESDVGSSGEVGGPSESGTLNVGTDESDSGS
jgi:hypothetical protein